MTHGSDQCHDLPALPSEILGEIFHFTLRGPKSNAQESLFVWNLGQVCKSWRHAFVTYPKLWSFILLDVNDGDDVYLEKVCNRFILCLERSWNHPLSLILRTPNNFDGPLIPAWKAFLSCSRRWKNIILCGDMSQFGDLAIECKGGFPLLQSLTLYTDEPEHFDCDAFPDTPCLTQFCLFFMSNSIASRAFSLSRLTKFTWVMDGISSDVLQVLLESLQDIQELRFVSYSGYVNTEDLRPFPPRRLEHLRILEVPYHHRILRVIKAPVLVELRLAMFDEFYPIAYDGDFYRQIVEAFIELSSCYSCKLVLADFTIEQAEPLIRSFSHLEELCIDDDDGSRFELLESLNDDEELGFTAFPNLRILTLIYGPYVDENLVKRLTSRLEFQNGAYIGRSSIPRPLEKIIIKPKEDFFSMLESSDPEPIPVAFKDPISDWAPFKVDVQLDQ